MILIIAPHADDHAAPVLAELRRRGARAEVLDLAEFPQRARCSVSFEPGESTHAVVERASGMSDLAEVEAVWLRRFSNPEPPFRGRPDMEADRWWSISETRNLLIGLGQMRGRRFVNPLGTFFLLDGGAGKVRQLEAARGVGLDVPRTLATNDPERARAFVASCPGGAVYKPFASRQGRDRSGALTAIYTVEVARDRDFRAVQWAPCIFQEKVPKAFELRVTVMGRRVFATEVHSQAQAESSVDYRRRYLDVPHAEHALPADVEAKILRLHRELGIVFSTGDLIVTPEGRYVFLEINWMGQFLWAGRQTKVDLVGPFCDLLQGVSAPAPVRCG